MEKNEVIRLNLKVHPDKDPALYQLLFNIVKEARSRRVMNLASTGLLMEQNGMVHGTNLRQSQQPVNANSDGEPILSITKKDKEEILTSSNNALKTSEFDEEELDAIGGMFADT